MKITLTDIEINPVKFAGSIKTKEDALEIIKEIDTSFSDWLFTEKVLDHFLNILWDNREEIESPFNTNLAVEVGGTKIYFDEIIDFIIEKKRKRKNEFKR